MKEQDIETYADASADLLGLQISAEQRPGVLHYLKLVAGLAPRVMDFDLAREDEGANVFRPVEPRTGAADEDQR